MPLRLIVLVLSLLAILSASTGGLLYYSALKEAAMQDAERQAATRVELIKKTFASYLSESIKPVKALAGMNEMLEMLVRPSPNAQVAANAVLDRFKAALEVDVCYLMDHAGNTIASSNRNAPDSFVGKNFAFRPYFQQAIHSAPSTYMALGTTSHKRGVYYSFPVFEQGEDLPIGLVVIKASIDQIEKRMRLSSDELVLITDPHGVIFITNRSEWLFKTIRELSPHEQEDIRRSRQFGKGPWAYMGLKTIGDRYAQDRDGNQYAMHREALANYPGWLFIHLRDRDAIAKLVSGPLIKTSGPIIVSLCILIGLSVFILYRKAAVEILQRKEVEAALRASEERYRTLYHNTPAMLHSIDRDGYLVSVSDYWSEVMGYSRDEVIGRKLTSFLAEESKRYAREVVLPQFFKTGFCQDVPYQFVKQNGDVIDVMLSAISEQDANGKTVRSLAVSIDVTQRNKAEEALKQAKEALSRYSKELEQQVRERTREISSILKYTPDVVSIKDNQGRYLLINTRFEEILGQGTEAVRGKSDEDLFPKEIADQFQKNDQKVLTQGSPCQVVERWPQSDGTHTYLSVKFPIYDEKGAISGVCGISTDITEVKKAQDQLRRLSARIMDSQEKERTYLARELHDELGQVLTALRMDAVWFQERMAAANPKAQQRAREMVDLIDQTIEEVRGMAIRLRPGVLDHLGLVDALEWYTADFERRTDTTCVFEHSDIPDINETVATAAYRIVQEALTNVARHGDARHVTVALYYHAGSLELSIADDGKGFRMRDLAEVEGLGVAGMRERAVLVGGHLKVNSEPHKGTEVHLSVPLVQEASALSVPGIQ
jgi:PAS domain S-box-containing protein